MLKENISIGDAELEIMKVLWGESEPVTTQVINKAVEEKNWKRTTVSTFLTRLAQKGAIKSEKKGNLYYYTPLLSEKDYKKFQTKSLIQSLFNGSIKEFAVSLFQEETLSQEDIAELKAIFDSKEK